VECLTNPQSKRKAMARNDGIISRIVLENIESHKKTVLDLKPGVNAIVGLSDAGKSAILRGVGLVFTNKGLRRSWWGGVSDVEITFTDGNVVSRQTDKKNKYFLLNDTVDNEYEAFRHEIPEEVQEALNVDEINISRQMDPHFLLSDSGGDVAKALNRACNLQVIDTAITSIKSMAKANSSAIKEKEDHMRNLEAKRDSFAYLAEMEVEVERYELLLAQEHACEVEHSSLSALLEQIQEQQKELSEIEFVLESEKEVSDIQSLLEVRIGVSEKILTLHRIVLRIQQDTEKSGEHEWALGAETQVTEALSLGREREALTASISQLDCILRNVRGHETDSKACVALIAAEPEIFAVQKLISERADIKKDGQALQNLLQHIADLSLKAKNSELRIMEMEQEFDLAFPDNCPLCGGQP
jgi:hypothetical protein